MRQPDHPMVGNYRIAPGQNDREPICHDPRGRRRDEHMANRVGSHGDIRDGIRLREARLGSEHAGDGGCDGRLVGELTSSGSPYFSPIDMTLEQNGPK